MEAKNFRIGNYIEYLIKDELDDRKEWWEVSKIDAYDLKWLSDNDAAADFREIELTEEWLFKFGFNRINEAYWCNGKLGIGYITNDEFFQYEYFSNKHKTEIIELKYVHQLQNIYFALTGIELTIK